MLLYDGSAGAGVTGPQRVGQGRHPARRAEARGSPRPPLSPLPHPSVAVLQSLGTDAWVKDATLLAKLKPMAEDAEFRKRWAAVKVVKKAALAARIKEVTGYEVSTSPMYDIQVGAELRTVMLCN